MTDQLLHYDRVLEPLVQEASHPYDSSNVFHAITGVDNLDVTARTASTASYNQINFEIPINGENTLLDSCIVLEGSFYLDIVNSAGGNAAILTTNLDQLVPRSFPLNNMVDIIEVKVNNRTIDSHTNELKPFLERMIHFEAKEKIMDGTPIFQEPTTCFASLINAKNEFYPIFSGSIVAGSNFRNIIGRHRTHRNYWEVISDNTDTPIAGQRTVRIKYTFREPLMHPLLSLEPGKRALYQLKTQLIITLRLVNEIRTALFYSRNIAPANHAYNWNTPVANDFRVLYKLIESSDVQLPKTRVYPFSQLTTQNSQPLSVAVATPATHNRRFNYNVQANLMPDTIAIFVSRKKLFDSYVGNASASQNQFDMTSMRINNLRIKIDGRSELFVSYDPHQLWAMSVANGLQSSFHEWYHGGKCIVVIHPGKDFKGAAGQRQNFVLDIQAECQICLDPQLYTANQPAAVAAEGNNLDGDYQMTVVMSNPAYLLFQDSVVTEHVGFDAEIVTSALLQDPDHLLHNEDGHLGGKVNFGKFFKKVWRGARRYLPLVNHYATMASAATGKLGQRAAQAQNLMQQLEANKYNEDIHGYEARKPENQREQQIEPMGNIGSGTRMGGRARRRELE